MTPLAIALALFGAACIAIRCLLQPGLEMKKNFWYLLLGMVLGFIFGWGAGDIIVKSLRFLEVMV